MTRNSATRRVEAAPGLLVILVLGLAAPGRAAEPDPAAVERGRRAMLEGRYLKAAWGDPAYARVGEAWGADAPDPEADPEGYARAFRDRYGLHPAPFPNEHLPMGLRRGKGDDPDRARLGIALDCLVCHGGSIGGTSYVGLGNTQLDFQGLLADLTRADGKRVPPTLGMLNTTRGVVNAGQLSAILISLRNPDLSKRFIPLPLGANLPEQDVPAWWLLGKKATMYIDGRTDARSVRTNMQFFLGELTAREFEDLEPTFRDIQAYLKSLKPPKYPFPIDHARAERGERVFARDCARCHGTYGDEPTYPNKIVALKTVGTDPARALGMSDGLVAHYNASWFGDEYAANEVGLGYQAPPLDGIWATAPYLHNGSVPTLEALLKSSTRPARFRRPPSTDFAHYDTEKVGWKVEVLDTADPLPTLPPHQARAIYDTSRWALGNGGHTFGDRLSDEERADLIAYLKTL